MTMPENPKIEALRAALDSWEWSPGSGGESTQINAVVEAAHALVVEYDEQAAYVQYLMDHPPSAADVRALMADTDAAMVERVVSTMQVHHVSPPQDERGENTRGQISTIMQTPAQPIGQAKGTLDA